MYVCGPGFRGVGVCITVHKWQSEDSLHELVLFPPCGPCGGPLLGILQRLPFLAFLWTMKLIIIEMIIWLFYGF